MAWSHNWAASALVCRRSLPDSPNTAHVRTPPAILPAPAPVSVTVLSAVTKLLITLKDALIPTYTAAGRESIAGQWGGWSHCAQGQETEIHGFWCPTCSLRSFSPGARSMGCLNFPENTFIDKPWRFKTYSGWRLRLTTTAPFHRGWSTTGLRPQPSFSAFNSKVSAGANISLSSLQKHSEHLSRMSLTSLHVLQIPDTLQTLPLWRSKDTPQSSHPYHPLSLSWGLGITVTCAVQYVA